MPLTDRGAAARAHAIGSSELGALFDHDDFGRTPAHIYARIVGGTFQPPNDRMRFGNDLEAFLLHLAGRRLGVRIRSATWTYRHPTLPFVAHTDGWTLDGPPAIVEAKNVSRWHADAWTDGPTPAVVDQVQAGMLLSGRSLAYVVASLAGADMQIFPIEADPIRQAAIVAAVEAFVRDHLEPRRAPPNIPGELILSVFAPAGTVAVEPGTWLDGAGDAMFAASSDRFHAKKREDAARAELAAAMADADAHIAVSPRWIAETTDRGADGRVGMRFRRRERVDRKAKVA